MNSLVGLLLGSLCLVYGGHYDRFLLLFIVDPFPEKLSETLLRSTFTTRKKIFEKDPSHVSDHVSDDQFRMRRVRF